MLIREIHFWKVHFVPVRYLPGSYNHHDLPSKEIHHRLESHNPLPNEIFKTTTHILRIHIITPLEVDMTITTKIGKNFNLNIYNQDILMK